MEEIELDSRDRGNLYRQDATNILALETTSDEIIASTSTGQSGDSTVDDFELAEALHKARDLISQTGQRFAYVVIKVCR